MEKFKGTPGEWKAKWSKYREGVYIVQTTHPSSRIIVKFSDDGAGAGDQSIANAHLIAAAPDLLEALQGLLEINTREIPQKGLPLDYVQEWEKALTAARAAISKALNQEV